MLAACRGSARLRHYYFDSCPPLASPVETNNAFWVNCWPPFSLHSVTVETALVPHKTRRKLVAVFGSKQWPDTAAVWHTISFFLGFTTYWQDATDILNSKYYFYGRMIITKKKEGNSICVCCSWHWVIEFFQLWAFHSFWKCINFLLSTLEGSVRVFNRRESAGDIYHAQL